jgi:tetratricopeptide (TPR) repeat protein
MGPLNQFDLSAPTPVASAISALSVLTVVALVYLLVAHFRAQSDLSGAGEGGLFSKILRAIDTADRFLISAISWPTGTRLRRPATRLVLLSTFFMVLAGLAATLPWPWGFLPIILGLLGIFSVFRHYSRHEDELVYEVPEQNKFIPIEGHLHREVILAVSFLLVFAPIAFAQLQENGYGFNVASDAGPFAFVLYTLIETAKSGSLIDYYDLYAERIGFAKISRVDDPSPWAKYVIMGYRLSLNLVLLATLKRLLDIAGRRSRGLDMRHIEIMLNTGNRETQDRAIKLLGDHALKGTRLARLNAIAIISQVADPASANHPPVGLDQRAAANDALRSFGEKYGEPQALRTAISGFETLLKHFSKDKSPTEWAHTKSKLGEAMVILGRMSGERSMIERAIDACDAALQIQNKNDFPLDWARTHNNLGTALYALAEITGEPEYLQKAVGAYESALEIRSKNTSPFDWASTQANLAIALRTMGRMSGEPALLEQAVEAFRDSLAIQTPNAAPADWALNQSNLGDALSLLGKMKNDPALVRLALEAFRAAQKIQTRERMPAAWARAQNNLGVALWELSQITSDATPLKEAITAHRQALEVRTREAMASEWAISKSNLALALTTLGEMTEDPEVLQQAVDVQREALEVHDKELMPSDWAQTQNNIGFALYKLALLKKSPKYLEEAIEAFSAALELQTPEGMLGAWTNTQHNLATSYARLAKMFGRQAALKDAIKIYEQLREHEPHDEYIERTLLELKASLANSKSGT